MTGLIGWIIPGQIPPPGTRLYNPQNAFQHFPLVFPGAALAITSDRAIGNKILDLFPLLVCQSHPTKLLNAFMRPLLEKKNSDENKAPKERTIFMSPAAGDRSGFRGDAPFRVRNAAGKKRMYPSL